MRDPAILEPADITRILAHGDALTLPDGTVALPVLLVVHPERATDLPPQRIRLGAIEQTYVLEPMPPSQGAPALTAARAVPTLTEDA